MKKSKSVALSFAVALCCLALAVYISSSTERLRAQLERDLPIGSSSWLVTSYLEERGWTGNIFTFDYEPTHPLSGRTIMLAARPILSARESYLMFVFDRPRGQEQKLQTIYVSSQILNPRQLPPELQKHAVK